MKYSLTCFLMLISAFPVIVCAKDGNVLTKLYHSRFYLDSISDRQRELDHYNDIASIAKENSDDSLFLKAGIDRIGLFIKMGRKDKVLQSLKQLEALARKFKDYRTLCDLLCIKGDIYTQLGFKEEALKILNQATEVANLIREKENQRIHLGYISAMLGNAAENSKEKIWHYINSFNHFKGVSKDDPKYRRAQVLGNSNYAMALVEQQQLDSAEHYFSLSVSYLDPEEVHPEDYHAIFNFISLHQIKENYAEAEKWLLYIWNKAEAESHISHQSVALYNLYYSMLMLGNKEQANSYLQKYAGFKDKLDTTYIHEIRTVEQELNEAKEQILAKEIKGKHILILGLCCFSLILCGVVETSFLKSRKQAQLAFSGGGSISLQEEDEKKTEVSVGQINELNALIKENDPSFMVKFYEYFPFFMTRMNELACTPLNHPELEICAYTKLNFSTKDIARYRKDTVRSVENRKHRIRKKLMLSSETDFMVWIGSVMV